MRIEGTNISMIRGDSETLMVTARFDNGTSAQGETRPFVEGDIVYLTVKKSAKVEEKILQKIITDFEDGAAIFNIEPEDTRHLEYKDFVYDIQLTDKDGIITTIVPKSRFCICEEVTYE